MRSVACVGLLWMLSPIVFASDSLGTTRDVGGARPAEASLHEHLTADDTTAAMPKVERREESMVEGRKVVRYEHDSLEQWKYGKPQRDYFFVVYPKQVPNDKAPLRVNLHSAGGSGESEMPSILKTHSDTSFYELYLDCRRNQPADWWWGYDSIRGNPEQFRNDPCPTEKRVLATVAWATSNFNIDRSRVYLSGVSMGGSGSLGIGLCRGDVFAAISVTVPAGAGHAMFRMNGIGHSDPPPLFDFSSQSDTWAEGQEALIAYCKAKRYFLAFAWGPFGHSNDSSRFHASVAEFPWLSIRKNEAYPVFTNASSDNTYPGLHNTTAPDQTGQINGFFRWKNVVDEPDRFVIELRLVRKEELKNPLEVPTEAIADVAIRRLQQFAISRNNKYNWRTIANGRTLQSGIAQIDTADMLAIPRIRITATPAKLEMTTRP